MYQVRFVCTRILLVCHSHVTRTLLGCHSNHLYICHSYVTRMSIVCHSYVSRMFVVCTFSHDCTEVGAPCKFHSREQRESYKSHRWETKIMTFIQNSNIFVIILLFLSVFSPWKHHLNHSETRFFPAFVDRFCYKNQRVRLRTGCALKQKKINDKLIGGKLRERSGKGEA